MHMHSTPWPPVAVSSRSLRGWNVFYGLCEEALCYLEPDIWIIRIFAFTVYFPYFTIYCAPCYTFDAICTCSGSGLPDWTLKLLHARRVNEAEEVITMTIFTKSAMVRPHIRTAIAAGL